MNNDKTNSQHKALTTDELQALLPTFDLSLLENTKVNLKGLNIAVEGIAATHVCYPCTTDEVAATQYCQPCNPCIVDEIAATQYCQPCNPCIVDEAVLESV